LKGLINRILLGLVVLLLGANLIVVQLSGESLMEQGTFEWTLFALAGMFGIICTVSGIRTTTKARRNRDKSSFVWARRGFVAALTVVLALIADAVTGDSLLDRATPTMRAAILILLVTGGPAFFAVAFHREYMRTRGSTSQDGGRRSGSSLNVMSRDGS